MKEIQIMEHIYHMTEEEWEFYNELNNEENAE